MGFQDRVSAEKRGVEYLFRAFLLTPVLSLFAAVAIIIVAVMVSSSLFTGIDYEEMRAVILSGGGLAFALLSALYAALLYRGFRLLSVIDRRFSRGALGALAMGLGGAVLGVAVFLLGGAVIGALRGYSVSSLVYYLLCCTGQAASMVFSASLIVFAAGYVAVLASLLGIGSRYRDMGGDVVGIGAILWATSCLGILLGIAFAEILGLLAFVVIAYGLHKVGQALSTRENYPSERPG